MDYSSGLSSGLSRVSGLRDGLDLGEWRDHRVLAKVDGAYYPGAIRNTDCAGEVWVELDHREGEVCSPFCCYTNTYLWLISRAGQKTYRKWLEMVQFFGNLIFRRFDRDRIILTRLGQDQKEERKLKMRLKFSHLDGKDRLLAMYLPAFSVRLACHSE